MPIVCSFILGLSGVLYELVFAQTLSVLFGQSVVQYSVTIGLFLAGMGVGSQLSEKWSEPRERLWQIQLLLALAVLPVYVGLWLYPVQIVAYIMCFAVGVATGAELPLLMRLHGTRPAWILGADYLGMLAACVLFPLLLLPYAGVFATLIGAAALNACVAALMDTGKLRWSVILPALLLTTLIFEPGLREWLSQKLIMG